MVNISKIDSDIINAIEGLDPVICPISHYYGPGVYIREMMLPVGTIAIGHAHKEEHICSIVSGSAVFFRDDSRPKLVTGPTTFISESGHKIVYAATNLLVQNIYANPDNVRNQEEIESLYIEKTTDIKNFLDFENANATKDFNEIGIDFKVFEPVELPRGFESVVSFRTSQIAGLGVFVSCPFGPGEYIAPFMIQGRYTTAAQFINHSDRNNTVVVDVTEHEKYLMASKSIFGTTGDSRGQELTIDYRELNP